MQLRKNKYVFLDVLKDYLKRTIRTLRCLLLTSDVYGGPTDIVTGTPREDANTCLTTKGCELLLIFMFLIGFGPFRKLIYNLKINSQ